MSQASSIPAFMDYIENKNSRVKVRARMPVLLLG